MKGFSCFALALGLRAASALQADPENPVTRVVGLLEGLQSRIQKDGEYEQGKYDKFACWCEETTGKTAATITSVRELLKTTGHTILRLKGSVATLSSEISGLVADIKKNQEQQAEQTNIREKQNAAYLAEKSELESAIAALQKAVQVLGAATTGASFVQTTQMAAAMSEVVSKMSQASMSVELDAKQLVLLSQLSGKDASSYAPQSATIQGILGDMYTTFAKNLQTSTTDEAKAHRSYEDIMATYQKQLNTLQETLVKKQQHKSEDEIQLADATQTYADSEEQLKAEVTLFDSTKKSCTEKTSDWSKRSKARTSELDGIKEALKILTSDESKAIFDKSIKPGFSKGGAASFVQLASVSGTSTKKALSALDLSARQTHSFRLAAIAAQVRMQTSGHFDAVLKAIDKLLVQLQEEEQEDIKKVDGCKESYQDITSNKNDLDWKIENNKAKVQKHEKAVTQKTEAKKITIKDIETAEKTLKDILKERTQENSDYKNAKSDDEKAIGLLVKAKAALEEFYKTALIQKPEPDMRLSDKNSAKGQTDGVLKMLDMIIEDLNGELAESKTAEAASQKSYEEIKAAVEDQKAKLTKSKINLEGQIAEENTAKDAELNLKKDNEEDLKTEKDTETDLKKTCDDAIKLQPERRQKRKIEADGLTQAKEFLAGLSSDAFVQTPTVKNAFPTFQSLSFMQRRVGL
jgi:hypothetical protein